MKKLGNYAAILIIFISSLWAASPLFSANFPDTHDSFQHVERQHHFNQALLSGNWYPYWLPDAGSGYGNPLFVFNWVSPYYLGFIISGLGFSLFDTYKILIGLSIPISFLGIFMYLNRKFPDNKLITLTGSFLYVFAPYRFLDVYVRGALGEALGFAVIPFVLWANLLHAKGKNVLLLPLMVALLVFTYPPFLLFIFPILILDAVNKTGKINAIRNLAASILLGLGLSAVSWLPSLIETAHMQIYADTKTISFNPIKTYFVSAWEGEYGNGIRQTISTKLGYPQWLTVFLGLISVPVWFIYRRKNTKKSNYELPVLMGYFLVLFILLFEFLKPVWLILPIFNRMLYSFRLVGVLTLLSALIYPHVAQLSKKPRIITLFSLFVIALCLYSNRNHLRYLPAKLTEVEIIERNTTLDSNGFTLPKATSREEFDVTLAQKRSDEVWADNEIEVKNIIREQLTTKATVSLTKTSTIYTHRLYFPGWQLYINDKKTPIEIGTSPYTGIVSTTLSPGNYQIELRFTNTFVRSISWWISGGATLLFTASCMLKTKPHIQ